MKLITSRTSTTPAECESRQLVSDLFHQLSQPLTTLCCSLELALLQTPTAEQYGEIVSQALRQAERVSSQASAIRELIDANQAGERGEVLDLRTAVEDAISDLLPVAESTRVQMSCVPGPACPVWFDAPRLRQGLFHLIGFVIGSGGAGAAVRIELAEQGTEAILTLAVSREAASHGPSTANSEEELWRRLGLGIARAIFEAEGGSLIVESGAEEGTSIEVRFLQNDRALFRPPTGIPGS